MHPPQVGDIIRTHLVRPCCGMRVTRSREIDGLLYFEALPIPPGPQSAVHTNYLSGYVVDGERIRAVAPHPKGTTGYSMNWGGRDGDGFDEIVIVQRAAQGRLF